MKRSNTGPRGARLPSPGRLGCSAVHLSMRDRGDGAPHIVRCLLPCLGQEYRVLSRVSPERFFRSSAAPLAVPAPRLHYSLILPIRPSWHAIPHPVHRPLAPLPYRTPSLETRPLVSRFTQFRGRAATAHSNNVLPADFVIALFMVQAPPPPPFPSHLQRRVCILKPTRRQRVHPHPLTTLWTHSFEKET